jgi:Uma2 family endonuclease
MTAVAPVRASLGAGNVQLRAVDKGRVEIPFVSWEEYEKFLEAIGDRKILLTYDRGRLEIMAPLYDHEWWKTRVTVLLRVLCRELGLEIQGAGSTTLRRQDVQRGLEADEWFYLENARRIAGLRERIDLTRDPPPDLALEVEGTRSALDRLGVYATLRVPEVWRYDGEAFVVHCLRPDGQDEVAQQSRSFPSLPLREFASFIEQTQGLLEIALEDAFRAWVRQHVLPRLQNPPATP